MSNTATEIGNQGRIKSMLLPPGWSELPSGLDDFHPGSLRRFAPAAAERVELMFFYRGRPLDAGSAAAFKSVLTGEQRPLSAAELEEIAEALGNAGNREAFLVARARTASINGRPVLTVEGDWLAGGRKSLSVFIDADGTGAVVQEIHYMAPPETYEAHIDGARAALASIVWL